MAVYFITGKLGSGKSLVSVGKIFDYLAVGKPVATNLDISMLNFFYRNKRNVNLMRLPDHPDIQDLEAIGRGRPVGCKDERQNGALVLDECATWFNAQDWQNSKNKALINWMLHARKLGWDVYFLVQDIELINGQARKGLAEHVAYCTRLDRIAVPVVGFIASQLGFNIRLPQVHLAGVYLGAQHTIKADTWVYRGHHLYSCYDTEQVFDPDYEHGTFCHLSPWHLKGRFLKPRNWRYWMRLTHILWRKYSRPFVASVALALGSGGTYATLLATQTPEQVKIAELEQKIKALELRPEATEPLTATLDESGNVKAPEKPIYERLTYAGFTRSDTRATYYFNDDTGAPISSDDPALNDYLIKPINSCTVEIRKADSVYTITCAKTVYTNDKKSIF